MHAVGKRSEWWKKCLKLSEDDVSVPRKLALMKAAHDDLQHLGGREGMAKAIRTEGAGWVNLDLDCGFFVRRCDWCLGLTTRGCSDTRPKHLPRPLAAGDVLGVDLKMVTPPDQPPWVMLLLVDFATNRLWAHDLDVDKPLGLAPLFPHHAKVSILNP